MICQSKPTIKASLNKEFKFSPHDGVTIKENRATGVSCRAQQLALMISCSHEINFRKVLFVVGLIWSNCSWSTLSFTFEAHFWLFSSENKPVHLLWDYMMGSKTPEAWMTGKSLQKYALHPIKNVNVDALVSRWHSFYSFSVFSWKKLKLKTQIKFFNNKTPKIEIISFQTLKKSCKCFGILVSLKIIPDSWQMQWRLFMCLYCSLCYEIPVVSVDLWSSLFALSLLHDSGHPLSKTPITSVGLVQALGAVITQLTNASKFLEICRELWLHREPGPCMYTELFS